MARMFRPLAVTVVFAVACLCVVSAQKTAPLAPQHLAQFWEAEHVSPPLLDHDAVERRTGARPFTADIGIAANRRVRTQHGRREIVMQAAINDLGNLPTYGGLRTIDATWIVAAPLWNPTLAEGQELDLPDWTRLPSARTTAPSQPAEIVLLRPVGAPPRSRYVVDRILNY
jgi:hypothetical protein